MPVASQSQGISMAADVTVVHCIAPPPDDSEAPGSWLPPEHGCRDVATSIPSTPQTLVLPASRRDVLELLNHRG